MDKIISTLIIIVTNVFLYWRTLGYTWVIDDVPWVAAKDAIVPKLWPRWWETLTVGILPDSRYYNSREAHILTLSLHTCVCVMIYLVFGDIIPALLFSTHPANNQCSIWVSGRGYTISALLVLIGFKIPILFPILWYISYSRFAASTILAPVIFAIMYPQWGFAGFLILIPLIKQRKQIYSRRVNAGYSSLMTQVSGVKIIYVIKTFGFYCKMLVFPMVLALFHNLLFGAGLHPKYDERNRKLNRDFWDGIISIGIMGILYILLPGLRFAIAAFVFAIAIWLNIITIQPQLVAERYTYFANIFFMLAMYKLVLLFPFYDYILVGVFVAYCNRTWFWMPAYRNDSFMIARGLIEQWDNLRMRGFRAMTAFRLSNYIGAFQDYYVLYQLFPWDFKVLHNLSNLALMLRNAEEAEWLILEAEKNYYNTGQLEYAKERVAYVKTLIARVKNDEKVYGNEIRMFK
jgi:hypothetical protein